MRRFPPKFAFARRPLAHLLLSADMPSPALPMIHRWHKLGDHGGVVSAGTVARVIREVRQHPLDTWYRKTLTGWGGDGHDMLRQFHTYCTHEINRRGGVVVRELTEARLIAKMKKHLRCECVWCGDAADFHPERNRRFCSADCRQSYFS